MVPAFGRGVRTGGEKLFLDVCGRPLIAHTLAGAAAAAVFDGLVIAAPSARHEQLQQLCADVGFASPTLLEGGERRQDTVRHALAAARTAEIVAIHDAARAACPPRLFVACVEAARRHGAATTAIPVVDTIKRVSDDLVVETLERASLRATQTPQAFARELIVEAHRAARDSGLLADDDAALVEAIGHRVHVVAGVEENFKVTHPRDLDRLRATLEGS